MNDAKTQDDWFRSAPWIDSDTADINGYVSALQKHALPGYDLAQKLGEWHDNGVVIFENVVDKTLIDKVNEDIAFIMQNHKKYHLGIDGSNEVASKFEYLDRLSNSQLQTYNIRLVNIQSVSRSAALLAMVPEAVSFLNHVFQSQPALLQSLTFPRGSEQTVHQDFPYVYRQAEIAKLAAFWIPLEDIHPDSGPLAYYCGSHKLARLGFFDWGNGAINQFDRFHNEDKFEPYEKFLRARIEALKLEPSYFLPRKGDLLIWHGALIHTGTKIRNPRLTRRSFVGHYTAVDSHPVLERNRMDGGFVFGAATDPDIKANGTKVYSKVLGRMKQLARQLLS